MKMRARPRVVRRSVSSVREKSALSKDKRLLGGEIRGANPTREQIFGTIRGTAATQLQRLHR
jgi:hypothetical protein